MTSLEALAAYSGSESEEESIESIESDRKDGKLNAESAENQQNDNQNNIKEIENNRKRKIESETEIPKKKLPVPSSLHEMFEDESGAQYDDPDQHGGRKRSFAHERGNWATFVFIQCPEDSLLRDCVTSALEAVKDDWRPCDDLHVSLSRTVPLAYHCIDPLVATLAARLEMVRRFQVKFSPTRIKCFTNDEKTRSFLSFQITPTSSKHLKQAVELVDETFADFRLEKYYEDPDFHLSFAWKLGDATKSEKMEETIQILKKYFTNAEEDDPDCFEFTVDNIRLKSGNKSYNFKVK